MRWKSAGPSEKRRSEFLARVFIGPRKIIAWDGWRRKKRVGRFVKFNPPEERKLAFPGSVFAAGGGGGYVLFGLFGVVDGVLGAFDGASSQPNSPTTPS